MVKNTSYVILSNTWCTSLISAVITPL